MTFATNFSRLAPGVWKHTSSGYVVHEVFSLDQAIACNGIMTFFDDDDSYAMFAGRTLGALIQASSASNLVGLAAATSFKVKCLAAPLSILGSGNDHKLTARPVLATANMAFTLKPRIFGLVTNAMDGFKPRKVDPALTVLDAAPTKPSSIMYNGAPSAGSVVNSGLTASPVGTITTNGTLDGCPSNGTLVDPIPHLVVRIPTGVPVENYWHQVEQKMEFNDKSEVKAYLAEAKVRFQRLCAVTPHSTDLYVSVAGVSGQLNVINADRKVASSTVIMADALYHWMRYNGTWVRVPALISESKMMGCWQDGTVVEDKVLIRYSLSPVGGFGGRSAMSLLGGIAGDANAAASMSVDSLVGMNVSGMESFGSEPGMPPQNVGELGPDYEARLLANKPKWTGISGWKYTPYPSVEHMGSAGALSILAAFAMSPDTFIGEYIYAFMHHRAPNRSVISVWLNSAGVTAAGGEMAWYDSVLGLNLFEGNNLEVAAGNIFGA